MQKILCSMIVRRQVRSICITELNPYELELFLKILEEDVEKAEDWCLEGVVNLYCSEGIIQILSFNKFG